MFGFLRRNRREALIDRLHEAIVASSRHPALYGPAGFPDSVEGRFEALTVHMLLVLRRLRGLPDPAAEVAQELVDSIFAHLEVSMRETGVGDMAVPKRMKKLGGAFYDRSAKYEAAFADADVASLSSELSRRLGRAEQELDPLARYVLAAERELAAQDLAALLAGPRFPSPDMVETEGHRS